MHTHRQTTACIQAYMHTCTYIHGQMSAYAAACDYDRRTLVAAVACGVVLLVIIVVVMYMLFVIIIIFVTVTTLLSSSPYCS